MGVILIADDEILTLHGISNDIDWDGIGINTVITAKNGIEALENIKECPPDILLTDVNMPRMNGIELARKIRTAFPDCAILFLTGYSEEAYLRSAIEVNAEKYINKPVNMEELYEVLYEIMSEIQEKQKMKKYLKLSSKMIVGMLLSSSCFNNEELKEAVDASKLNSIYGKKFCCLLFSITNSDDASGDNIDIYQLQNGIDDYFTKNYYIPVIYADDENRIVCFLFCTHTYQGYERTKNILTEYKTRLPSDCAVSLSGIYSRLEDSSRSFLEAKEKLSGRFYFGTENILERLPSKALSNDELLETTVKIKETIINGEYISTSAIIKELQDILVKTMPPTSYAKSVIQEISHVISQQKYKFQTDNIRQVIHGGGGGQTSLTTLQPLTVVLAYCLTKFLF
jgi:DNA-binding NarL/FixJ family response regulator